MEIRLEAGRHGSVEYQQTQRPIRTLTRGATFTHLVVGYLPALRNKYPLSTRSPVRSPTMWRIIGGAEARAPKALRALCVETFCLNSVQCQYASPRLAVFSTGIATWQRVRATGAPDPAPSPIRHRSTQKMPRRSAGGGQTPTEC